MLKEIMEKKINKDILKIIMININCIYVADRQGRKKKRKKEKNKEKYDNI